MRIKALSVKEALALMAAEIQRGNFAEVNLFPAAFRDFH
jgi:hypothetical protein